MTISSAASLPYASLIRRLGAIVYDFLIITALLIAGTFALMPFTHGHAISAGNPLYFAYLWLLMFGFYVGFWCKGGQTLGMMAWGIRLVPDEGNTLTFSAACVRFFASIFSLSFFGLGFIWALFNRNRLMWHDFISNTHLIRVPKK